MQNLGPFAKLALVLGCLAACKSKPDASPPSAASTPAAVAAPLPAPPSASASASVAEAPPSLTEDAVKSFVARWEAAQNQQDFAAYSALYADRFMGVKRVGSYSKRFDRAGWLADRKPMFAGGAKVRVTELALVATAGATRAVFTQEFTSTGFRDVGKKELFLVPGPGGVAISREEMLSSEVSSGAAPGGSVLAYHRDGAVLQRGFDKAKLNGAPRLLSAEKTSPISIAFEVAPELLGDSARAWLGREVTAYTASGATCSGRVARFEVRVQAVPHFGMRQGWNGELDQPKAAPQTIASAIERMAQGEEHFVVGVLDRACAGIWASGAPAPFTPALPAKGGLRAAAVAAFKALPAYAELQKKFVKEGGAANAAWESTNGELSVVEVRPAGRPALVLIAARAGAGCAGFNGSLSALWQITGSAEAPQLKALSPSLNELVTLRGAIDQGAAGGLGLLAGPDNYDDQVAVLRVSPKVARRVLLSTSFWDCDC